MRRRLLRLLAPLLLASICACRDHGRAEHQDAGNGPAISDVPNIQIDAVTPSTAQSDGPKSTSDRLLRHVESLTTGPDHRSEDDLYLIRLVENLKEGGYNARQGIWLIVKQCAPQQYADCVVTLSLSNDADVRESALDSLWNSDAEGARAAPIAYAMYHKLGGAHLAWLVGRIKSTDQHAARYLDLLDQNEHPAVRMAVVHALSRTSANDDTAVTKLVQMLEREPDLDVALAIVDALQRGPKCDKALDRELNTLRHDLRTAKMERQYEESVASLQAIVTQLRERRRTARAPLIDFLKQQ